MLDEKMESHGVLLAGIGIAPADVEKAIELLRAMKSGEEAAYERHIVGLLPGEDIQAHVEAERRSMTRRLAMWVSGGQESQASILARIENYALMPILLDIRAFHGDGAASRAAQALRDHIQFLREFREKIRVEND